MKKIIAAGAIGLLALTGCSSNDEPTPTKTVFVTPSAPAPTFDVQEPTDNSEVFLDVVRKQIPSTAQISDADLIEFGNNICETIDNGGSIESIAGMGLENGVSPSDVGFLIGASVGSFCPRHIDKVQEFAERHGAAGSAA